MRLRNIKGSEEIIATSSYVVQQPLLQKGKWQQLFGNQNPVYLEIGMGKGKFLVTLAKNNPHINYIGIEKYTSVMLRAVQKLEQETEEISNLKLICMDAEAITEVFEQEEIGRIYLNFSDPWPKARHARRRLPSREFLEMIYKTFPVNIHKKGKILFCNSYSALRTPHSAFNKTFFPWSTKNSHRLSSVHLSASLP
ncbi:MAG: tRNA (guanosine(46)-N7)-methyltransferase TrmB, partial [Clostridiales bacterium]|nr:tRNA (guanosine(46)-N7)-methyltransferase TrmB [Clostridiales bacterium]